MQLPDDIVYRSIAPISGHQIPWFALLTRSSSDKLRDLHIYKLCVPPLRSEFLKAIQWYSQMGMRISANTYIKICEDRVRFYNFRNRPEYINLRDVADIQRALGSDQVVVNTDCSDYLEHSVCATGEVPLPITVDKFICNPHDTYLPIAADTLIIDNDWEGTEHPYQLQLGSGHSVCLVTHIENAPGYPHYQGIKRANYMHREAQFANVYQGLTFGYIKTTDAMLSVAMQPKQRLVVTGGTLAMLRDPETLIARAKKSNLLLTAIDTPGDNTDTYANYSWYLSALAYHGIAYTDLPIVPPCTGQTQPCGDKCAHCKFLEHKLPVEVELTAIANPSWDVIAETLVCYTIKLQIVPGITENARNAMLEHIRATCIRFMRGSVDYTGEIAALIVDFIAHCRTDLLPGMEPLMSWYLLNYFTCWPQKTKFAPLKDLIRALIERSGNLFYTMFLSDTGALNLYLTNPLMVNDIIHNSATQRDALIAQHPAKANRIRTVWQSNINALHQARIGYSNNWVSDGVI